MTVEVSLKSTLDPSIIEDSFADFVNSLNLAAVAGKQYVLATEQRDDGTTNSVAFETRNITRIREIQRERAYIG